MSLADVIDSIYDAIDSGESIDFEKIEEGKFFVRRLMNDFRSFKDIIANCDLSFDGRGWLQNNPLPVTVEILNREETPGEEVHIMKGFKSTIVVYYGICPELENFVSIILWPLSNTSKVAYRHIYDLVTTDTERKRVVRFSKKYGLQLPNTIHPGNDNEIDTIEKPRHVYDWESVPYLKETADTILSHSSPLNFKKVYIDETRSLKSYVNLKVIIGRIEALGKERIQVLVPSFYRSWLNYNAKLLDFRGKESLEVGSVYHFLIMEKLGENVEDVVVMASSASPADLLGHMLSMGLYNLRIRRQRLRLVTVSEYSRVFEKCMSVVNNFCRRDGLTGSHLWTPENIFHVYLSSYFRIIHDHIYFVPNNQFQMNDNILELFDELLSKNATSISERGGLIFDKKGMKIDLRPHAKVFQMVKLMTRLKFLLIWNENRQYLSHKLFPNSS